VPDQVEVPKIFTEDEMTDIVRPAQRVAVAFGRAMAAAMTFAAGETTSSDNDQAWRYFATQVCKFTKEVDRA
jgi:hypothetical protein